MILFGLEVNKNIFSNYKDIGSIKNTDVGAKEPRRFPRKRPSLQEPVTDSNLIPQPFDRNSQFKTHSHTMKPFDAPGKQAF